jgi:hypothetical protein
MEKSPLYAAIGNSRRQSVPLAVGQSSLDRTAAEAEMKGTAA